MIFCANDEFVSLFLCSKWDVNTILIRALSLLYLRCPKHFVKYDTILLPRCHFELLDVMNFFSS